MFNDTPCKYSALLLSEIPNRRVNVTEIFLIEIDTWKMKVKIAI